MVSIIVYVLYAKAERDGKIDSVKNRDTYVTCFQSSCMLSWQRVVHFQLLPFAVCSIYPQSFHTMCQFCTISSTFLVRTSGITGLSRGASFVYTSCIRLFSHTLTPCWPIRGKTRILTKLAHSIIKPLRKPLYEVGRSLCDENKWCMNCTKYTLKKGFHPHSNTPNQANF